MKVDYGLILKHYREVRENTTLLYPDKKSLSIFENLVTKYKPTGTKIYDTEIASVMIANDIKQIATFNKEDFQKIKEIEIFE